ncbi:MAG TPA: hypothetical protein DIS79_07470 [Bacteroidetes bacterium]|nr:hypothetical protein [Bacteroidota bacterium]HRK04693.1 hypothetical protein [Chlorobiota bacterium]
MYVPVLQCREDECRALKDLSTTNREHIVPLLEMTGLSDKHTGYLKKFLNSWSAKFYFDPRPYYTEVARTADHDVMMLKCIGSLTDKSLIIPVLYLDENAMSLAAIGTLCNSLNLDVCLRLTAYDLATHDSLKQAVSEFLSRTGIPAQRVHLLFDYGRHVRQAETRTLVNNFEKHNVTLRKLGKWPVVVLHASCMPADLRDIQPGKYEMPRVDLALWLAVRDASILKEVVFSDRTVMYPQIPLDETSKAFLMMTASAKYTTKDSVVIYRGRKILGRKGSGFEQYIEHAKAIVADARFSGRAFSKGDEMIADIAASILKKGKLPTGNTREWRRAAMSHHMTLTADQVS